MYRRLAALLCTIVVGCSTGGDAEADNSCTDRADRMGKEMAARADAMSVLYDEPGAPTLPIARGQAALPQGPLIQIDAAGNVRIEGRDLGRDRAALRRRIDASRDEALGRRYPALTVAYLWADKTTRVNVLIDVAKALPADLALRLVVADAATAPTPAAHLQANDGVKQLMREVAAARDGGDRATSIANALRTAIAPCTPMVRLFGELAADDAQSKGQRLARGVPAALRQCKCKMLNVDLVEYSMLAMFGAYARTLGWLALPSTAELTARRTASVDELVAVLARR